MVATVAELARVGALRHGDRIAVVDSTRRLTFSQVWDRAARLARGFVDQGMAVGDRVVILTGNRSEWLETDLAITLAGLTRGRLNARDSAREFAAVLGDLEPKAVVVAPRFQSVIGEVLESLNMTKSCLLLVVGPGSRYERWIESHPPIAAPRATAGGLYCASHSAGTSGNYKAAMYTHERWVNVQRNILACLIGGTRAPASFLHAGPVSHQSGVPIWSLFFAGFTSVIMDKFDPEAFLRSVEVHRVTHTILVPTMVNQIVEYAGGARSELASLSSLWYSGSPMSEQHVEAALEVFGPILLQGYGGSDSGCMYNTILYPEDHVAALKRRPLRLSSCGRPIPFFDIELMDPQSRPVAAGEPGEIWVRGDAIASGYWNRPELTAQAFAGGWFRTGDIATRDEEGYVTIADRKNDMIISGGLNVYPREVEDVVRRHPSVKDVVVVSAPDDRWGEAVTACVALVEGASLTLSDVQIHCRELGLASYKKPLRLEIVTEIPISAAGKPLRRHLREPLWAHRQRLVAG